MKRDDAPEDWQAAYELLDELLDLPPAEREEALAARRAPAGVGERVRRLLRAADDPGGLLDRDLPALAEAAGDSDAGGSTAALVGARFGPYQLVEEIGRGGMGVVFRARRADGAHERDVALKLLTLGQLAFGSAERLRHEQAVLARLDHPGIATLLDGGVAEDGTPWLAMELVDGEPIDAWCAGRALDARQVVRLFQQVCDALAYAHRNLVVHRDLKPGNIFVDHAGRVRILDFGIAKLLDEGAPEATSTRILTAGYGAPEQLAGGTVTTATDVFAMGAVLHRLLAGRPSFPARPTTPVDSGAATARPSASPERVAGIDRDLDNAVRMAMRPEPERRYASAQTLRDDLERWLGGRPLLATPDSFGYRLRKYVGRHRAVVAAATLGLVGMVAGTTVALWQATVAAREQRRAEAAAADARQQLRRAEEVTRFLVDTFAAADPDAGGGRDVTAEEIVDQGVRRIASELEEHPATRRQLLSVLGEITYRLGDLGRAEELLGEALAIPVPEAGQQLRDLRLAAMAASAAGRHELAAERFAAALALAPQVDVEQRTVLELEYASHLTNLDRGAEAEERLRDLLASAWLPADARLARAQAGMTLAQALVGQGRFAEAAEWAARSLPGLERELGGRNTEVAAARSILAGIEADLGRLQSSERLERATFETYTATYGPRHHRTLLSQNNLATYLKNRGRFAESAAMLSAVLAAQEPTLGPEHPFVAATHFNLGEARLLAGDVAGALDSYRRAVEIGEANPETIGARLGVFHAIYGRALGVAGDDRRAAAALGRGLELLEQMAGRDHPITARVAVEYAAWLNDQGRHQRARELLATALPVIEASYPEGSRELALARLQLGRALAASDPVSARSALTAARGALLEGPFRARYAAEIEQASALLAGPLGDAGERSPNM